MNNPPLEQRIIEIKEKGYNFNVRNTLNNATEIWKQILLFGTFTVIFSFLFQSLIDSFISRQLNTIPIDEELYSKTNEFITGQTNPDELIKIVQNYLQIPLIIKKIILTQLLNLLVYPLGAGVVYCAYKIDTIGRATFKDLIKGFHGSKFINLLILGFIATTLFLGSAFLFFIPLLFFIPALILTGAFIVINDLPLGKSIKYSFLVAKANFGSILSLLLISFLISKVLGIFMCYVGLVITIPFSYAMVYAIYKNTIGYVENEDELISNIGDDE